MKLIHEQLVIKLAVRQGGDSFFYQIKGYSQYKRLQEHLYTHTHTHTHTNSLQGT